MYELLLSCFYLSVKFQIPSPHHFVAQMINTLRPFFKLRKKHRFWKTLKRNLDNNVCRINIGEDIRLSLDTHGINKT